MAAHRGPTDYSKWDKWRPDDDVDDTNQPSAMERERQFHDALRERERLQEEIRRVQQTISAEEENINQLGKQSRFTMGLTVLIIAIAVYYAWPLIVGHRSPRISDFPSVE